MREERGGEGGRRTPPPRNRATPPRTRQGTIRSIASRKTFIRLGPYGALMGHKASQEMSVSTAGPPTSFSEQMPSKCWFLYNPCPQTVNITCALGALHSHFILAPHWAMAEASSTPKGKEDFSNHWFIRNLTHFAKENNLSSRIVGD